MARYEMSDGSVVDTLRSSADWREGTSHNGQNTISLATGSQWDHEHLYRSRRGRYYVERSSQWQGSTDRCEWISNEAAACWLARNEYEPTDDEGEPSKDFPDDLREILEELTE